MMQEGGGAVLAALLILTAWFFFSGVRAMIWHTWDITEAMAKISASPTIGADGGRGRYLRHRFGDIPSVPDHRAYPGEEKPGSEDEQGGKHRATTLLHHRCEWIWLRSGPHGAGAWGSGSLQSRVPF